MTTVILFLCLLFFFVCSCSCSLGDGYNYMYTFSLSSFFLFFKLNVVRRVNFFLPGYGWLFTVLLAENMIEKFLS